MNQRSFFTKNIKILIILPIACYQYLISPLLFPSCRFYPSCSNYARQAINKFGWKGVLMAIWRILRCNPFSAGGVDEINNYSSKNE